MEEDDLDTVGYGARLIGRPLQYNGAEKLISDNNNLQGNLSANNVDGICLPGRNIDVTKTENWFKAKVKLLIHQAETNLPDKE